MQNIKQSFSKFITEVKSVGEKFEVACFVTPVESINISSQTSFFKNFFYWNKPSENFEFLAIEEVLSLSSIDKVFDLKNSFPFFNNWDEHATTMFPLFIGGEKFNTDELENEIWKDYAKSEWIIPEFLIFKNKNSYYLMFNFLIKQKNFEEIKTEFDAFLQVLNFSSDLDQNISKTAITESGGGTKKNIWKKNIETALDDIEAGTFRKVVLSRLAAYKADSNISIAYLLTALNQQYPDCYIFAFKKNESVFFGASPEKLLKISNGILEIDSLAGSIARGKSEDEDKTLGAELLKSVKDRREQKAVTDYILNILRKYASDIKLSEYPKLKKLSNIQHLWSEITAEINEEKLSSILKELHPTPAVCGFPKREAVNFIDENEDYKRGLYAGFTGWVGNKTEAEFSVSIRSALLQKNRLYLFAGCGIVNGSEPDAEYEETNLKLKPILSLFDL